MHSVIRGEVQSPPRVIVDWVNATFHEPSQTVADLVNAVRVCFEGLPINVRQTPPILGFGERWMLSASAATRPLAIGSISIGSAAQNNRWMLQLTGTGCERVTKWRTLHTLLKDWDARITRLDLAADFPNGEMTIERILELRHQGKFLVNGQEPALTIAGDWLSGEAGRTVYLGKPQNGKLLRAYEKGKKHGDPRSQWLRIEVQFGSRGRIIPLEALVDPDPYFAGAYPALEEVLPVVPQMMQTRKASDLASLGLKLLHLRLSYGATIAKALATTGANEQKLMDALRSSPQVGGDDENEYSAIHWDDVCADLKRHLSARGRSVPMAAAPPDTPQ